MSKPKMYGTKDEIIAQLAKFLIEGVEIGKRALENGDVETAMSIIAKCEYLSELIEQVKADTFEEVDLTEWPTELTP